MRIALLTRRFDPAGGGTERDLITTLDVLRRGGHEVTVYAGEIRGSLEGCEVRAVHTPRVLGRTVAILRFAYLAPPLRNGGCASDRNLRCRAHLRWCCSSATASHGRDWATCLKPGLK